MSQTTHFLMNSTQYPPSVLSFIWIPRVRGDLTNDLLVATPLIGFILWLIARLVHWQRALRHLPPGPKGLPIFGDVLHIADQDWLDRKSVV